MLKSANKTETNVYTLEVTVSGEDFNKAILQAYNKQKNKIQLPGFRKGKAPLKMIEKFYGEGVFYEDALDIVYPGVVGDAIKEAGIEPVAAPHDLDVTKIGKDGVEMTMKVTVKPEISIDNYKGIEADKGDASVCADDVKKELASMQERNARVVTVDDRKAKKNDIAVIDFEGFVDGEAFEGGKAENYNLKLGSGNFIPGFEEQIIGHSTDEEFTITVTFPEDYQAEELKGKEAEFKIKLHEIKAKELPEVDDDFVKDVSEKETLDEYKEELKETIAERLTEEADKDVDDQIANKLMELLEGEIPEAMYDNQASEMVRDFEMRLRAQGMDMNTYMQYMGMDVNGLKGMYKEEAEKRVKLRLALETVAKKENIEVTDADLDEEYQKMADAYKMEIDKVKAAVPADSLTEDVKVEKALKLVKDKAVIK